MEGFRRWCRRTLVCGLTEQERKAIAVDREIELSLRLDWGRMQQIFLYGPSLSGKTTFLKQMRIIHGEGYSEEQRLAFAKLIFQNIFTAIKALANAMTALNIPYTHPENQMYAQWIQDVETLQVTKLEPRHTEAIRRLWADPGLRTCYSRRREYQLLDSTEYYMSNLDRIAAPDFIPNNQDVLRVQVPTEHVSEWCFTVGQYSIGMVDTQYMGRQFWRWICDITSIIYVVSIGEYDQQLDGWMEYRNRMEEYRDGFHRLVNCRYLRCFPFVLFLNKMDILADKIQTSDLQTYYPEFTGKKGDAEAAMNFIRTLFLPLPETWERGERGPVYGHFTCAIDAHNIRQVFDDVKNTVSDRLPAAAQARLTSDPPTPQPNPPHPAPTSIPIPLLTTAGTRFGPPY
ncbi:hypothetical protein AAFF_G00238630 [Aldrovandia affinis]|uniref:Uncharacterized protein n=1 Tax=Aldrovandia affinis TaxID=143900 RepID=A0AAD7REK9_9TELE|nr:hypothetical protein AAFF_G00238630 [Aldrovandia affinis]